MYNKGLIPCLKEMTYSKALDEQAKGSPIEFVYINESSNLELMKLFGKGPFPSCVLIYNYGKVNTEAIKFISNV